MCFKASLIHICLLLSCSYHMPSKAVPHRWLSYDATVKNFPMHDALWVLYFSWLSKENRELYKEDKQVVLKNPGISDEGISSVNRIQNTMRKKGLWKKGSERKKRIYDKIIFRSEMTKLIANFYQPVLPMFKSFVLIFEQKCPQVHKLHSQITSITRDLMACFMRHNSIKGLMFNYLYR